MANLAYFRVSSKDQTIESQRAAMGGQFDEEFCDEGVSGKTAAADRPGFAKLLGFARKGDVVHVYALDRLGRDAIDVQKTMNLLKDKGVSVNIHGLGVLSGDVGGIVVAILAQFAQMELNRITERTAAGREVAQKRLAAGQKTQNGKTSMGRPVKHDPAVILAWREENNASFAETAAHFGAGIATVKRMAAAATAKA